MVGRRGFGDDERRPPKVAGLFTHGAPRRAQALGAIASEVVVEVANDGMVDWASASARDVLGWAPSDLVGRYLIEFVAPSDAERADAAWHGSLAGNANLEEIRIRGADGSYRAVTARQLELLDAQGEVTGHLVALRAVRNDRITRRDLEQSEERYRILVEITGDVIFRADLDATLEWVSPSSQEMTGWLEEELVGRRIADMVVPEDRQALLLALAAVVLGERARCEARLVARDGTRRWTSIVFGPMRDEDEQVVGSVGRIRDAHAEIHSLRALRQTEKRMRVALESAPVGVAVVDLDRRFVQVNSALCALLGRDASALIGRRMSEVLDADGDRLDLKMRAKVLSGRDQTISGEYHLLRPDASRVWVTHVVGLLREDGEVVPGYVSAFLDTIQDRAFRERRAGAAVREPLAQIATRRDVVEGAAAVLGRRARTGQRSGLLYLDVDNLRHVDDSHAAATAERLLIELARRIAIATRSSDVVWRLDGDEFVIALTDLHDVDDAAAVASRIRSAMEAPFEVDGAAIQVTVSIGVALARIGDRPESTLEAAEASLRDAKGVGGARIVVGRADHPITEIGAVLTSLDDEDESEIDDDS